MATNDNESKPIRLKFSKSFLFFPTWAEITEGDVSTIKCTKDNAEGEWVTVPTNSGLHTNFGQCAISFSVDNVGDGSRPVVVGFVPRTFTAFDQKLTTGGGTGLSSTGKFYNNGVKIDASTLKFTSGDRVTLKFDFTRSQTTVVVENKKTKKSTETTFKTAFPQGWIVPSVSVSGNYTAVSVDLLLDATPLDVFAARIGNETDEFDSDAFGSFYYRLYRKMNDNDVVKVGKDFYTKADIKCRTILAAPGNTPWGRGPLPGLLDVDSTTKQVTTAISDLFFVSMTDATFTRKLFEMTKGITTDNSKFLRRVGGSNAQMLRAMHAFGEIDKESNPSPVSTSATSSPNGTGSAAMLQQLMDRVAALESAQRSSTPTEDKDLKRAASRVAPKTVASSAALIARKPSVKPGGKRVIPRAAPEKKIVTTKPVSTSFSTSNALLASLQKVRKTMHDLRTMGEKGSPTDEDLKQMANLRERIAKEKMQAAKDISTMTITQAMSEEARSDVVALLTEVVAEGDQWPGNVEILQSVMKKVPIDFAPIVKDLELAATAAYDGSISFLRLLLSVPNLELDLVELVQSALFNQTRRIPVTNLLIDMAGSLGLATVAEDIADVWQEFFDDICSNDRALAREVRDGRLELIAKMLKFKTPPVTAMFEGPDGQTAFTRAAREGDIDLMTVLLTTIPGVVDINRVSKTDKTTALIQAVYKNQVTVVRALSSLPGIDVNHACPEGTALSIARTLRRHPDIIRALEAVSK